MFPLSLAPADMRDSRTYHELADKEFKHRDLWERRRRAVAVLTNHRISIKLRNDQYTSAQQRLSL